MSIATKRAELEAAHDALDNCAPFTPKAEALERRIAVLECTIESLEIAESERPRREAEARLAYHDENDTLDLY